MTVKHFGVKGMHWGVRKSMPTAGSGAPRSSSGSTAGDKAKQHAKTVAALGATFAIAFLATNGHQVFDKVVDIADKRAADKARQDQTTAVSNKPAKPNFAKKKGGAFKITTL